MPISTAWSVLVLEVLNPVLGTQPVPVSRGAEHPLISELEQAAKPQHFCSLAGQEGGKELQELELETSASFSWRLGMW